MDYAQKRDAEKAATKALYEWATEKGYTRVESNSYRGFADNEGLFTDIATNGSPDPYPSIRVYEIRPDKRTKIGKRYVLIDGKSTGRLSRGDPLLQSAKA